MKILFVCAKFPPIGGGPGVAAHHLGKELASRGHEVTVLTELYDGLKEEEQLSIGFNIKRIRIPFNKDSPAHFAYLAMRLGKLARNFNADIVHFHDVATLFGNLRKIKGAKTVFKYGGDLVYEYLSRKMPAGWDPANGDVASWNFNKVTSFLFKLQRRAINNFDFVYSNCQYGRDLLAKHMGVPREKLAVVHNATDTTIFDPAKRDGVKLKQELGLSGTVVLSVGRLVPWKGNDILIEALKGLDVTAVIAGDGPERVRLEKLATSKIIFTGNLNRDQVLKYLPTSDVFVLPSFFEWGPNSLQEAMSMAKVCIATRVGGTPEMIEDGKNGFLVEKKDADGLKKALEKALSLSSLDSKSIGLAARKTVLENYSKETNFVKVMEIYKKCL